MKIINQKSYENPENREIYCQQSWSSQSPSRGLRCSSFFGWKMIITLFRKSAISKLRRNDDKLPEVAVRIATVSDTNQIPGNVAPRPGLQYVSDRPRLSLSNDYLYILN